MSTVAKAFLVLEHLATQEDAGVSELSRALKLPVSTVHRLLVTLIELGYVAKRPSGQRCSLTLRVLQLSGPVLSRLSVRKVALLHMERLSAQRNETVNLGILQSDRIVYVETIPSSAPLRIETPLGERLDPHCTALGKAICAHLQSDTLAAIMPRGALHEFTPATIKDHAQLIGEFLKIRRQGYAVDDEERHIGIRSVAAPIRDRTGEVIAAVSVAGPTIRMRGERLTEIAVAVKQAAASISADLGFADKQLNSTEAIAPA